MNEGVTFLRSNVGPRGGKPDAAPRAAARKAEHSGESIEGILGLHNPRENTATNGIEREQPWHIMAAHMLCRGATNSEIAAAAQVSPGHVSQLRAQRWFQQRLAVIEHESGEAVQGLIQSEAIAAFERLRDLAENSESERIRMSANLSLLEHAVGKPTQKIISSISHTTHASPSEEMESIQQQLAALRSSAVKELPTAAPQATLKGCSVSQD